MFNALVICGLLVAAPDGTTLEALESIGYVDSMPTDNPELRGVVYRDSDAFSGLNLLTSRHTASAQLVDMDGVVQHHWEEPGGVSWMHVELLPNGDLLALAKDHYLLRLDRDSNVIWRVKHRVHHDFTVMADGRILTLSRRFSRKKYGEKLLPILEDLVLWISPDGEIQKGRSLYNQVHHLISKDRLQALSDAVDKGEKPGKLAFPEDLGDVTHTNSINVLHRDIPGVAPAGSLLFSCRELSRVIITNASLTKVLWVWGKDELEEQHHATQLSNGHLMIFDNGIYRRQSRVLEVDAKKRKIAWSYSNSRLFTKLRGSAQRLPNGNVLITESDSGHVLEVTRAGETVWEFWNPFLRKVSGRTERDSIYRFMRYPTAYYASNIIITPPSVEDISFLNP